MTGVARLGVARVAAVMTGVALLAWGAVAYFNRVPRAEPAYAVPREFSAGRAMVHVQQMTMHTHAVGSQGNAMVRNYLLGELRVMGVQAHVQSTTAIGTRFPVAGRVHNVVGRIPGTQPGGKAVLLMAHYDAVAAAPGAGDDASGVATILETARAIRSGPQLTHDVIILFTDGEEPGLLGAAAFVREHPWARDAAVVLNFEARGTTGPSLMFETGPGNLDVVRVLRGVRGARATSLSTAVYRRMPNDTDLSELAALGMPAMNFAFIGGVSRYHSAQDDVAHLDPGSVQHQGEQALALTRVLANGPLPRPRTSDAVFFNVPVIGLVLYSERLAVPLALVALLVVGVALFRGRGQLGSMLDVALGALAVGVVVLVSATVSFAIATGLQRLHGALRSGVPDTSAVYALAIALIAAAVSLALFAVFTGRRPRGLLAGALVVWGLLALGSALAMPAASYVFTWPLIAVAMAASVDRGSLGGTIAQWCAAAVSLFIVVPIVHTMAFVALGLNVVGACLIALFVALLAALHVRLLQPDRASPISWSAPALAVAAGVLLLIVGALTVRTDADHPGGASLIYATEADSSGAWLSGYAYDVASRGALRHFIRELRTAPGDATGAEAPPWLRRTFPGASTARVPRVDFPRSEASLTVDSSDASHRYLSIRVRPGPGVSAAILSAEPGQVEAFTVDSKPVATDRYRRRPNPWRFTYVAPRPDSGFVVSLATPANSRPTFSLITWMDGIPPLQLPTKPPGIVPANAGNATWTYYRLQP